MSGGMAILVQVNLVNYIKIIQMLTLRILVNGGADIVAKMLYILKNGHLE